MITPTTLKEMICSILASYKASSTYHCMSSIGLAVFLPCLLIILLHSSPTSAFRIVFPPFDDTSSLLSIARDPSLVPPFFVQPDLKVNDKSTNEEDRFSNQGDGVATTTLGEDTIHFCFLVHGFQGRSIDLSYFETTLKHRAFVEQKHLSQRHRKVRQYDIDNDSVINPTDTDDHDGGKFESLKTQDMVVHNCVCNEGKTKDGVINGGNRLVDEIRKIINFQMEQRHTELIRTFDEKGNTIIDEDDSNPVKNYEDEWDSILGRGKNKTSDKKLYNITISIIGNSMGGLYGRYAIAKLIERHCVVDMKPAMDGRGREQDQGRIETACWILDGKYRLRLDTFCTTASPHLGVSQHTWIRIPRIVEFGVAATMGETGRDLFRLNNLLYTMATDSVFLDPLASFRKRIAFANCYGTDFPVPVGTAAFLSGKSTYPHKFLNKCKIENECQLVIASLRTTANAEKDNDLEEPFDELHQMSDSLDRLGWKKVFVDLRKEMLSIEIPRPMWVRWSSRRIGSTESNILKKFQSLVSKDVINAFEEANEDNADDKCFTVRAPLGHNMIVAFSRNRQSTFVNKGGRPLVDVLAKDFVQDIFVQNEKALIGD